MLDKIKFMEMLKDLTEIARTQDNVLSQDEIKNYFNEMELEEDHFTHIYNYLGENKVRVENFVYQLPRDAQVEGEEENLREEDSIYLKMYMKELGMLDKLEKDQWERLYESVKAGDVRAKEQLINGWLPKVVAIARKCKNRGVFLEDLIQEGNIGLLGAVEEWIALEEIVAGEKFIKEYIKEALENAIEESQSEDDLENTILGKSNLLNEASIYLSKELGRVATIDELSQYTRLSVNEIEDMIKLSLDGVKTGKGE